MGRTFKEFASEGFEIEASEAGMPDIQAIKEAATVRQEKAATPACIVPAGPCGMK
ncbi:MAG: hypothetical protein H6867_09595 [Rhodospirillales bacterium]|nr:hypothetical protein [Rhodospirillales bacterium]MCB9995963.1 hypothetical protein [Rhodospirillales bacterium]